MPVLVPQFDVRRSGSGFWVVPWRCLGAVDGGPVRAVAGAPGAYEAADSAEDADAGGNDHRPEGSDWVGAGVREVREEEKEKGEEEGGWEGLHWLVRCLGGSA